MFIRTARIRTAGSIFPTVIPTNGSALFASDRNSAGAAGFPKPRRALKLAQSDIAATSLRTAFVIALLMALGGVLSACGFSNTFNYGHGQGACVNCGGGP